MTTGSHWQKAQSTKRGIVFVSQFDPEPVGHGGNHRAYQIAHDLARIVGEQSLTHITWPAWDRTYRPQFVELDPPRPSALRRVLRRIGPLVRSVRSLRTLRERVNRTAIHLRRRAPFLLAESPLDPLMVPGRLSRQFSPSDFVEHYESTLRQIDTPVVCVVEHVGFSGLLPVNQRLGIATFACIQNIESLDTAPRLSSADQRQTYQTALSLAEELHMLTKFDERLMISRVEASLLNGLGLSSTYYPYVPVGEILEAARRVAQARRRQPFVPGLFLMLGSVAHATTRHAFEWFLENAVSQGLPEGVSVVVVGKDSEQLMGEEDCLPNITLKGWVDQQELDALMVQAHAILTPQRTGFGALTRLVELACAGIPVVTSRHPTYAMPALPNQYLVDDDWKSWCEVMCQVMRMPPGRIESTHSPWEAEPSNALELALQKYLA